MSLVKEVGLVHAVHEIQYKKIPDLAGAPMWCL